MKRKSSETLQPLPYWCYLPRSRWTAYHHLMMWSRSHHLGKYRTMQVGTAIYQWLVNRVSHKNVTPAGAVLYAQTEFFLNPNLEPYAIVTGALMG